MLSAQQLRFSKTLEGFKPFMMAGTRDAIDKLMTYFASASGKVSDAVMKDLVKQDTGDLNESKIASAKIEARRAVAKNLPVKMWVKNIPGLDEELKKWATKCGTAVRYE
jgi:hypothetical protein